MLTKDPWYWTHAELMAEICDSAHVFQLAGCAVEDYPNTIALARELSNQDVSGATFLALDSDTLRNELGVQRLNERLTLLSVIKLLRSRSIAYQQHASSAVDGTQRRRRANLIPVENVPSNQYLDNNPQSEEGVQSDWAYLLRWEGQDEKSLITDEMLVDEESVEALVIDDNNTEGDDSDDDGKEEEQEEIDDDDEEEEEEEEKAMYGEEGELHPSAKDKLTLDQVVEIINERIAYYTSGWMPNKGVPKEDQIGYDPLTMWEEAERTNQRLKKIEEHKVDVEIYTQRLDKACQEITGESSHSGQMLKKTANCVRRECQNLETTIQNLELAKWLLSIYSLTPEDDDDGEVEIQTYSQYSDRLSTLDEKVVDLSSSSDSPPSFIYCKAIPLMEAAIQETLTDSSPPPPYRVRLGDEPENASISSVKRWGWAHLCDTQDRKRIVSKALQEMGWEDRESLRDRLITVDKTDILRELLVCVAMLAAQKSKMQGVLPKDLLKIITLTRLFLCWWQCNNCFKQEPTGKELNELTGYLEKGSSDPKIFYNYVSKVMTTTFSQEALQHPEQPSQAEIIDLTID